MAKTNARAAVAAYGKAAEKLAAVAASNHATPDYLAANEAKGEAYSKLPRGTRAYATAKHG